MPIRTGFLNGGALAVSGAKRSKKPKMAMNSEAVRKLMSDKSIP